MQSGKAGETFEALTTQFIQPKRGNPYAPAVVTVLPMSAFNLNVRSAGGMLGAAVGAADHAVFERDPIGASALEGLATGSGSASDAFPTLHFQIEESIDVTGIRW